MNFETDKKKDDKLYRMKKKLGRKFVPNFKMRLIANLAFIFATDLTLWAFSASVTPKEDTLYSEKLLKLDYSYFLDELAKGNENIIIYTILSSFSLIQHILLLWILTNLNTSKALRNRTL